MDSFPRGDNEWTSLGQKYKEKEAIDLLSRETEINFKEKWHVQLLYIK